MKSFHLINLGCKVNRVETDSYGSMLSDFGLAKSSLEDADLIIVNTCTVTGEAEKKTRKAVRHAINNNLNAEVIVTGCASAISPSEFTSLDSRVNVVPKASMREVLKSRAADAQVESIHHNMLRKKTDRTRVGIKVQDGCNNSCTYCIVCKARGKSRSLDPEDLLSEVKHLNSNGVKEIVLTGINIGAYNFKGVKISDLISKMLDIAQCNEADGYKPRFRLSSIEPSDITDDLIDLLAMSDGRVCRHLHIPLQSGSSEMLRAMHRNYDAADYSSLIQKIRERVPKISLTTDIIVGFPGETDEDFNKTCKLATECGFSKIHVFPYSKREGTLAATFDNQVPDSIKKERARYLRSLASKLREEDASKRRGLNELYLVQEDGMMMSESYYEVLADSKLQVGELYMREFVLPD